jgi:hypothetical protein
LAAVLLAATWCGPAAGEAPAFDGHRALRLIEEQVDFGPRVPGSPSHARALVWMEDLLRGAGMVSFRQEWTARTAFRDSLGLVNVIATAGPDRPGGILLGAHWDSRPWADQEPDASLRDRPVPGANDGASGTAVLLVLAEVMARRPPPIPVTLVFFDGEDLGRPDSREDYILGSRHFASRLPVARPEVGLVIDMVCRNGQLYDWEGFSYKMAPRVAALLEAAAAEAGRNILTGRAGESILDDHVPLLEAGIPSALLIGLDDPDWHTLSDLPGNCSGEALQDIGSVLVEVIYGGYLY